MLRAAYRLKQTTGAWADGGASLEVHCGCPTCRDHLGSLHCNAATPESGGARTWRLFALDTLTHQITTRPGHWQKSGHARRSWSGNAHTSRPTHGRGGTPTAPNEYAGGFVNTEPVRFRSNVRGELLMPYEGRLRALPASESVKQSRRSEGLRWDGTGRIPNERRIATVVPLALAHDLSALHPRGHPLLHTLTIACPAEGHISTITFDDIEAYVKKEARVPFGA